MIFLLFIVLLCCTSAVSAVDYNDTIDNVMSEVDSNDEFVSVSADDQVNDVDETVLSAQDEYDNLTMNNNDEVLSIDSNEDSLGVTTSETNNYLNDIKASTSNEFYKFIDSPSKSYTDLNNLINDLNKSEIILENDYVNQKGEDSYYHSFEGDISLTDGIFINHSVTIDGKGHVIDANNLSEIFFINASNVKLKNIIFKNGIGSSPITCYAPDIIFINCTFLNNHGDMIGAGAISCYANTKIINSTFIDNYRVENENKMNVAIYYQDVVFNIINESISYSINNKNIYDIVKFNRNCNVTIINSIFRNNPTHEIHYDRPLVIINGDDNSTNNTKTTNSTNNTEENKTIGNNTEPVNENNSTDVNKTDNDSEPGVPVPVNFDEDNNMSQITPTITIIANNTYVINGADDIVEIGFKTNIKNKIIWVEILGLLTRTNVTSIDFYTTIKLTNITKDGEYTILCGFYDYVNPVVVGSDEIIGVADKKTIQINNNNSTSNNQQSTTENNTNLTNNTVANKTTGHNTENDINPSVPSNNSDIESDNKDQTSSAQNQTITPVVKTYLLVKPVNVKKTAKKLVLQVVLKQGSKLLKGKKITFMFNGKKYTAKTNKKGIAKVTINKNILKKLKTGKKVKYQISYGKTVSKKNLIVK